MTEEQIKEQLSRHFVELVANRSGYKCAQSYPDHGCDLTVTQAKRVSLAGRWQYLETGKAVQIQLKSTCESNVSFEAQYLKYDLDAANYNALVARRDEHGPMPFMLVLLVLPDDPREWLAVAVDQLTLSKAAYWYHPEAGAALSSNTRTRRIHIPLGNKVDIDFVDDAFARFFP